MMKFFKKQANRKGQRRDPHRIVTFSVVGARLRQSVLFLSFASLTFVLILELPLKAQSIFDDSPLLFWLAAFLSGAFFTWLTRWASADSSLQMLSPVPNDKRIVLFGMIAGSGIFLWYLLINNAFSLIFPSLFSGFGSNPNLYSPRTIFIAILGGSIMLPIGEELLFRGYILSLISQRRSFLAALIISTLIYGVRALDPFGFFTNFGIGLFLGWITRRLHITAAILAHVVGNLLLLGLLFLQ